MGFTVKLCHNNSPVEKIGKSIDSGIDITGCTLKEETSVLKPVIRILSNDSSIYTYNYMYIAEFERYYFIDDIKSVNNNRWEISGHVDVLETYKNSILAQTAVIKRQQSKYNLYLDDPDFHTLNNERIQTLKFPTSNGFTKTLQYIIATNGAGAQQGGV